MDKSTADTSTGTTENNQATTGDTKAPESKTPEAKGETNTDATTGLEVDTDTNKDLLDGDTSQKSKEPEDKKEEKTDGESKETKEKAKDEDKQSEPKAKTLDELGYSDVRADQVALAELATEMGVSHDDLKGAITDGKLDTSKLDGLTSRDAQLLKTTVEAEVSKLSNEKTTRRNELYNHAGSEANFKAMVEWANTKSSTDEKFKANVSELRSMMVDGGTKAELAVKSMFDQFKADPATSLTASGDTTNTTNDVDTGLTKRQKVDAGWDALKNKYK